MKKRTSERMVTETYVFGHEGAEQGHQRPEADAEDDDPFSFVSVAQVTEQGREEHVRANEDGLEKAARAVTDVKVLLRFG